MLDPFVASLSKCVCVCGLSVLGHAFYSAFFCQQLLTSSLNVCLFAFFYCKYELFMHIRSKLFIKSGVRTAFCIDTDIWFRNKCQKCRLHELLFIAIMPLLPMRRTKLMCIETAPTTETVRKERIGSLFWSECCTKYGKNNGLSDKEYQMSRKN